MTLATEQQSIEAALARLPTVEAQTATLLARVRPHLPLAEGAPALDLGAAQGLMVVALQRNGLDACGVEPWEEAIANSQQIAEAVEAPIEIRRGTGEEIPYEDESFDLVTAFSVMEHVIDPDVVFREVARVLRPGGGFFFYTTSAICPRQREIRLFPLFPWYPDRVRRGLMKWSAEKHPWFVNHTEMPALHWYTPKSVGRSLMNAGYTRVLNRWDLKRVDEVDGASRSFLAAAKGSSALRLAGDLVVPDSSYLAIR